MNSGPAGTSASHLDLENLIAHVTGQPVGDRAEAHLARCEQCRAEASRWAAVSDGVRSLAADTTEAAQPDRPRPLGPRSLRPRVAASLGRHRTLALSAAAALVLVAGVGYAASSVVHISFGSGGTGGAQATLTAVSGCPALDQASGTLVQVNGSSLVIRTASGQPLTVTTTAGTRVYEGGSYGELPVYFTDGATVTVAGRTSGGTIAASLVALARPGQTHTQPAPGMVVVHGTVADVSASGFTVVTAGGSRLPVTTSGDTVVSVVNAALDRLPAGATVLAIGSAGPHGTLAARAAAAILQLPQGGPQLNVHLHLKGCSPGSIDNALAIGG
jgi:hypothetical protein